MPRIFVLRNGAGVRGDAAAALRDLVAHRLLGEQCVGNVLGLDVSLRSTGYAVVDMQGGLLRRGTVASKPGAGVLTVADSVSHALADVGARPGGVSAVYIEEFMKQFAAGRFHTRGLFALAQLNGIVAFEARRRLGVHPVAAMPNRVRKAMGVEAPASGGVEVKRAVVRWVSSRYPAVVWPRPSASAAADAVKRSAYDEADAVLVALYGMAREREARLAADAGLLATYLGHALRTTPPAHHDLRAWLRRWADAAVANTIPGQDPVHGGDVGVGGGLPQLSDACARSLTRAHRRFRADVHAAVYTWVRQQRFPGDGVV